MHDFDLKQRVDLWVGSLRQWEANEISLNRVTEEERLQAQRYHFEVLRNRALIGKALLRTILAQYVAADPLKIRIERGEYGKPYLPQHPELHFNVSHSEDMFLCGVSSAAEIGVDVEAMARMNDHAEIAERYFTKQERDKLHSVASSECIPMFFRYWTRKEAFVKGTGKGLSLDLRSFDVSADRVSPVTVSGVKDETDAGWTVHSFSPCAGYAAAVALCGELPRLHFFSLNILAFDVDQKTKD
jgi:4'-phosphopantetheinyl transferase